MNSIDVIVTVDVDIQRESFPPPLRHRDFWPLFQMHAHEARGKPFKLNYSRLYQIEVEQRLVWIVARDRRSGNLDPVGYSLHFWYSDLHFGERVAADDLWFVLPSLRGKGVGRALKEKGHAVLRESGVVRIYDMIRTEYNHPTLMADLNFTPWGTRWVKEL